MPEFRTDFKGNQNDLAQLLIDLIKVLVERGILSVEDFNKLAAGNRGLTIRMESSV